MCKSSSMFVPEKGFADWNVQKQRTANAYDGWARLWDLARFTNATLYRTALASVDERHSHVLDVGCGTGLMSAKLAATGRQVVGVDLSAAMIARARRRRGAKIEFRQADAEALPFGGGEFDAVVNLISLHHYPQPWRALAEFHRVLRPGGRLVLVLFDRSSLYIRLAQMVNPWTRRIAGHTWQKTRAEAVTLVNEAGFSGIEVKPVRYWIKTFAVVAERRSRE